MTPGWSFHGSKREDLGDERLAELDPEPSQYPVCNLRREFDVLRTLGVYGWRDDLHPRDRKLRGNKIS